MISVSKIATSQTVTIGGVGAFALGYLVVSGDGNRVLITDPIRAKIVAALEWSEYRDGNDAAFADYNATLAYLTAVVESDGLPQGPQGPQGDVGPAGPQGATGDAGTDGADGQDGAPGVDGQDGSTGPAGSDGIQGPQGVQGIQGEVGPPGSDGSDGAQGTSGNDGAVGPAGPKGDTGDVGPQGPQGVAGNDGADGAQGIQGPIGLTGPEGPQGLPGADGNDGAQGIQGLAGNDGATGPQGDPGNDGIDGAQGIQGPIGPQGPIGLTGPAGSDGVDGSDGAQGLPGNDGVDGAQGQPGTDGAAGPNTIATATDITGSLSIGDQLIWNGTTFDPTQSVSADEVGGIAEGSTLGLQQELLANAGQPGLTVLAVGFTTSGKVQGCSLGAGNVVEVYANGADFNAGTVLYREFMAFGEPICFTGLSNGAIITSTQGFYGISEQVDGADESPMPLLSYGLSFTSTFFYGFRNCQSYLPGATGANQGWIHVVNGPLESVVRLANGSGVTVQSQENITLNPWEYVRLYTSGNQEYKLESTNPIMACHAANMDLSPFGRFYDSRLVMPLTNDGLTWPRSGFVSAPFDNTQVAFFTRDNTEGFINSTLGTGVSPGSPVDFDAAIGVGTGANDADYEPNGATRVLAVGLISAYSGADSAGLEASPLMPTSAMSQVVAQPFHIDDTGDGGDSGVAIASPYSGEAKIYEWDDSAGELVLAYTVPLTRNGVTIATQEDQKHPAAGLVANETASGAVLLDGDLRPGVVVANVPITVVAQNGTPSFTPTIRSQNGTTTDSIVTQDDETLMLGVTPALLKAEITEGADGLLYRREIIGGVESWVLA